MLEIMDFYQDLNQSTDSDDCFYRYMRYVGQFGLTGGILISTPNHYLSSIDEVSYTSAYDPAFFRDYLAAGGLSNDLSAQLLFAAQDKKINFSIEEDLNLAPELLGREATKEELYIEEMSLDYGIDIGFAALLASSGGYSTKGIGISAIGMNQYEYLHEVTAHENKIQQANYLLGLSLKHFEPQNISKNRHIESRLSQRQHDVLRWLADGLRLQEIAQDKIHRSIHTINKELQVLKKILEASTHEELVAKAIVQGLIR